MNSQTAAKSGSAAPCRFRSPGWALVVVAVAALSATACSKSNSSTAAAPNPATVQTDVKALYTTFFSLSNRSVPAKLALIEDGSKFGAAESAALKFGSTFSPFGPQAITAKGARVKSVTLVPDSSCEKANVSAPCAQVTYSIVGTDQQELLANQRGYAVYVNGHWLVSKTTLCGLFHLIDLTPRACPS